MNREQSTPWVSQSLHPPGPIDTIVFDVDGVLWDTADSWDAAVSRTVDFVLRRRMGRETVRPVTEEELRAFRRAGGLNNDWDLTYTLIALRLAGRDDFEAAAQESGGRGRAWAESLLQKRPLAFDDLVAMFNEIYWGAEDYERLFDQRPRFVPDAEGCWHRERPLFSDTLLDDLRAAGVRHFGIATGRNRVELSTVLRASGLAEQIAPGAMITGDVLAKPHGRVLALVLDALDALADDAGRAAPEVALFCGDTRDDLDAVHNYRALHGDDARWIGAAAVVPPGEAAFFRDAGSDAVIEHVDQLPQLVAWLRQRALAN